MNITKNGLLKSYKHRIWDFLEDFQEFNIQSIPRRENKHANRLASLGASYDVPKKNEDEKEKKIKVVVRPTILDNNTNWQVFDFALQIANFLQNEVEFLERN